MPHVHRKSVNGKLVEYTIDGVPQPIGNLGDKIAAIANPIAKVLRLPCIDKTTGQVKSESACWKMKTRLNAGMSLAEATKLRLQGK